jgi:hypothetical protein
MYFDGSVSIHSDVSVVLGIDTHVGNAGSCGEQFAAADSIINPPFECSGALLMVPRSEDIVSGGIGSDPQTDVALIKISVATDFPYVTSFVAVPNG